MNGAGKTTTFNMINLNHTITSGDIYLRNINCKTNKNEFKQMIGYCPQNDALPLFMTAYETVKYMALMRGASLRSLDDSINRLLDGTDLKRYAQIRSKYYSGGTKRKLNLAIALQSNPWLLILDEPTTGVDPASRRFMWACIQECQKNNQNVVLSSHR